MSGFRLRKSDKGKSWKPAGSGSPFSLSCSAGLRRRGGGGVLLSDGTLLKETTMEKIFQIELRKVYPLLVAKAELQNK